MSGRRRTLFQRLTGRGRVDNADLEKLSDLIGAPVQGRVLIVDDVVSAGTSVRESIDIIADQGAKTVGIAVALDRQERGAKDISAMQELANDYQLTTLSIANLGSLFEYLKDDADTLAKVSDYRRQYGV